MGKGDRLHHVYYGMISRCYNEQNPSYKYYSKNNITVCDEWINDYLKFKEWALLNGYDYSKTRKDQSLDRIDNSKGYSPENCRWVSHSENCKNTTRNIWLTHNGKTMVMEDWSKEIGLSRSTIKMRLESGLSVKEILSPQKRPSRISNTGIEGISCLKNRGIYQVVWKGKYIGVRKTLEEAIKLKEEYLSGIDK